MVCAFFLDEITPLNDIINSVHDIIMWFMSTFIAKNDILLYLFLPSDEKVMKVTVFGVQVVFLKQYRQSSLGVWVSCLIYTHILLHLREFWEFEFEV